MKEQTACVLAVALLLLSACPESGVAGADAGRELLDDGGVADRSSRDCPEHSSYRDGACRCLSAYRGPQCNSCAQGYYRFGDDCVEGCDADTCSGHGACRINGDRVSCLCDLGWDGQRCDACAPGHEAQGDGCVDLCAQVTCAEHGLCDSYSGRPICYCEVGWVGQLCEQCAVGYVLQGGLCVPVCVEDSCSYRGSCDGDSGLPICTCQNGYAGERCELCARGFSLAGDACVPDCQADTCDGHGTCQQSSINVWCTCDSGYEGDYCELCAFGYERVGLECLPVCREGTCSDHGSCDDSSGAAVCSCYPNYQGAACESCADGHIWREGICMIPVVEIAAGEEHACARLQDNTVRCWGVGDDGYLGYGLDSDGNDIVPPCRTPLYLAPTVEIGGAAAQLALGNRHSCVLRQDGQMLCFGVAYAGVLGYGNLDDIGDDELPVSAGTVQLGGTAVWIGAGYTGSCAVLDDGSARCWGRGSTLGLGRTHENIGDDELPTAIPALDAGGPVRHAWAASNHGCLLLESGAVRCWGEWLYRATGYPVGSYWGSPAENGDVALGGPVAQLAVGQSHNCAVREDGALYCWGNYAFGKLGLGHLNFTSDLQTPQQLGPTDVGGPVARVEVGASHSCAQLQTGELRCWGENDRGALGYGHTDNIGDDETPASAGNVNVGGEVVDFALGSGFTCALLANGFVRCWGLASCALGAPYVYGDHIGDDEEPATRGYVQLFR